MHRFRISLVVLAGAVASAEALDYRSIDGTGNNLTSDHYGSAGEVLEIVIPTDDPFFGDLSPYNIIELDRSNHIAGFGGIRQQINEITAWIDGSSIPQGCVDLVDVYFNPVMLSEGGLDPIFPVPFRGNSGWRSSRISLSACGTPTASGMNGPRPASMMTSTASASGTAPPVNRPGTSSRP